MGFWKNFLGKFRLSATPHLIAEFGATGAILPMSPDKALQNSTLFACVRLISQTVGTLPCTVFRREGEQGKVAAPEYPLAQILRYSPNADFTSAEYFTRLVADLCLWGNHFSEVSRDLSGGVVALTGLDPSLVSVGRKTDGSVGYAYADPYRGWREIAQENIFHVRGFSRTADDIVGLSPISCARISLDIAASADTIAANTYKNGMRPTGVLGTDRMLTPEQREQERKWVSQMAGGLKNSGGLLVLEAGYKYQQLSMNPADAQMLENRSFNVEDICRWYGVPPYMVGHTTKSTSWGSGLEQQNQGFATYALRPYLDFIEGAIHKWLIPAKDRGQYFVEFNLDGLLRADSAGRAAHYSTALQNGWMNRNEVRAKENYGKIPGGEVYTVQSNLLPIDKLGLLPIDKNQTKAAQQDGEEDETGTQEPGA